MRSVTMLLWLCGALVAAGQAVAEGHDGASVEAAEATSEAEAPGVVPLGSQTRAWMDLQRSGAERSPHPTGLTPPEEYRSRKRHLDSYTHPIPWLFELEELGGEGG